MKAYSMFICLLIAISLILQCNSSPSCISVVPPKIRFTGKQTSVEQQIVGEYKELEKDAWSISSVQTRTYKSQGISNLSAGDIELYKALKVREFHQMKIRGYKNESAIGETYNGYVAYIATSKYESDITEKELLLNVIKEENKARTTIFTKTFQRQNGREPSEIELRNTGKNFARDMVRIAQKNDLIQNELGQWVRK